MEQVVESVMLDKFTSSLNLEVVYPGRGVLTLSSMSVERPGLPLAGYLDYYNPNRLMIIGRSEYEYLQSLETAKREKRIQKLFEYGELPGIILCRDLSEIPELTACAKKASCPIFRSKKVTTDFMSDLYIYLNRLLAPSVTEHGVLMEVFGVGILLTGKSGVGKSETAMELIKRGHRLVADDSVIIKEISNELVGTSPDMIRYFMELRGIGIINVKSMYGSGSILNEKKIEMVVQLEHWQEGKAYDRIGDESDFSEYHGVKIPRITIPVSPGRNLAIIIEVAARNFRLKSIGYDASDELIDRTVAR